MLEDVFPTEMVTFLGDMWWFSGVEFGPIQFLDGMKSLGFPSSKLFGIFGTFKAGLLRKRMDGWMVSQDDEDGWFQSYTVRFLQSGRNSVKNEMK